MAEQNAVDWSMFQLAMHTQGNTDAEVYKVQFRLVQNLGSVTYNPYAGISNDIYMGDKSMSIGTIDD